ncbi:MAG: hypothetical protein HFJ86_06890 [Oscillospiraceae bacterium]|nr:hypothetical protein [Oscillospiraceae bacterium]
MLRLALEESGIHGRLFGQAKVRRDFFHCSNVYRGMCYRQRVGSLSRPRRIKKLAREPASS